MVKRLIMHDIKNMLIIRMNMLYRFDYHIVAVTSTAQTIPPSSPSSASPCLRSSTVSVSVSKHSITPPLHVHQSDGNITSTARFSMPTAPRARLATAGSGRLTAPLTHVLAAHPSDRSRHRCLNNTRPSVEFRQASCSSVIYLAAVRLSNVGKRYSSVTLAGL